MNILCTGGAGFIGSHLCERLVQEGHRVICFDDFSGLATSYDYKWKNIKNVMQDTDHFRLVQGDIRDKGLLHIPFSQEKLDAVIHLAAKTGVRPSVQDPVLHCKVNIVGTVNILRMCVKYGVKNIVFASSSSIYGANSITPFSEDDKADSPISPYAATKKAGENISHVFCKLYALNTICLRPFTVYGPRQRKEMAISSFVKKIDNGEKIVIFGDGSNSRDYSYVSDVVDGFVLALERKNGFETFNIGGGHSVSLSKLICLIEEKLGKKAEVNYSPMQLGEVDHTFASVEKAKKILGYTAKVGIEDGLDSYIEWYKNEERIEENNE